MLSANVTDTATSSTKPVRVRAELVETGDRAGLHSGNAVNYSGIMLEEEHKTLEDGPQRMRFTVEWSNGHVESDDVPFRFRGNIFDVIVSQLRL